MRYWPSVIGQLAFFWCFLIMYVICIVPLSIIVAAIGEGERE